MAQRHQIKPFEWMWGNNPGPFDGNDKRISGGVRQRCILCGSLTTLRLSHAIPKWAFKWHKDAYEGFIRTRLMSKGVAIKTQDANKHYLLCELCEQRSSVAESYAKAIVLRNKQHLKSSGTYYLIYDRYWNLRLDLIAQFIAVTALRIHYCESVPLNSTKLPLELRNQLRHICFDSLNLQDVAISAWRFVPPKSDPGHDPKCDIFEAYEDGLAGRLFIMLVGGIEWSIFFNPIRLGKARKSIGFQGHGLERILSLPYTEYRLFKHPEKWVPRIKEYMRSSGNNPSQ